MVPRSAIVLLVFLVFVGACASEQIAQEGTEEPRRGGEVGTGAANGRAYANGHS